MIQHENWSLLSTAYTKSPQVIRVLNMRQLAGQQNLESFLALQK